MSDAWRAFSTRLFDQNLFAIKLGLDGIRTALRLEDSPECCAPGIVVGGTNGKGTTAAMISNILQEHGLRVGLYTSPHLLEVRERFRINGRPVSREKVLEVGRPILKKYGKPDSNPCLTFFELTTLMAARIFAEEEVDVIVWEVGLGGRLDAVNAIEPAITVITTIDMDHEEFLGNTIRAIASEKGGLIRPDVPVIIGEQDHSVALETLTQIGPHSFVAGRDFPLSNGKQFHLRHANTAMKVAQVFLKDQFSVESAKRALEHTRWPGRMERLVTGDIVGPWLLDGAHNRAGASQLYDRISDSLPGAFLVSALRDKDRNELFARLNLPPFTGIPVFGVELQTKRGASADQLVSAIPRMHLQPNIREALTQARLAAGSNDVVVFGSLYLLGEVLAGLGFESDDLTTWRSP